MSTPRIFQNSPLNIDETITLSLDAAHYIGNVRRAHENDKLILFNGAGGEYVAEILTIRKDKFTVKITAFSPTNNESPLTLHLAQGIARGDKMDLIIQKAVELGVQKITPLMTERSTVKLEEDKRLKRQQHWQGIAISACEQSGRNIVPEIAYPISLSAWVKSFSGLGLLLYPHSDKKISDLEIANNITLIVGPEGGLSQAEIELILQKNVVSVNLGPRILRTETAPLAVIAMLQGRFGDMG